ncbi:hypothetical protein [Actinomadura rugatobispora]|uniref:Uncharacterized protein n=1 Tax=Actinomadura rugatobispora TaxID=1994 RepID=A0ABW0ZN10_9ACTN|nr:hypothetical protein GCM10010200_034640 [Actinomadura rugatobispora]
MDLAAGRTYQVRVDGLTSYLDGAGVDPDHNTATFTAPDWPGACTALRL